MSDDQELTEQFKENPDYQEFFLMMEAQPGYVRAKGGWNLTTDAAIRHASGKIFQVDYMSEAHSRFLDQIEKHNLGLCPHCDSDTDGLQLLMIGRPAFIACHECKCYWTAGIMKDEGGTTKTWLRNLKSLSLYKQILPLYHYSLEDLTTVAIREEMDKYAKYKADSLARQALED